MYPPHIYLLHVFPTHWMGRNSSLRGFVARNGKLNYHQQTMIFVVDYGRLRNIDHAIPIHKNDDLPWLGLFFAMNSWRSHKDFSHRPSPWWRARLGCCKMCPGQSSGVPYGTGWFPDPFKGIFHYKPTIRDTPYVLRCYLL